MGAKGSHLSVNIKNGLLRDRINLLVIVIAIVVVIVWVNKLSDKAMSCGKEKTRTMSWPFSAGYLW